MEGLSKDEQKQLELMMTCFQEASQETIKGGERLLPMCSGCAFKKGTDANNNPSTVLTALQCVLKRERFYCHERFENGRMKICSGWKNIINNGQK